jgi:hypothetical protein
MRKRSDADRISRGRESVNSIGKKDQKMMNVFTGTGIAAILAMPVAFGIASGGGSQYHPQAEISNGELRAKLFLPDGHRGFYQGTRFDWAGVVSSLEYKGHNYYGQWYTRSDPRVHDFAFEGPDIVTSTCCTIMGPVEEFKSNEKALGFDDAAVGGTFIKIGVGVLRKDSAEYDVFKQYQVVDPGKWTVKTHADSVEFTHQLNDPASGYGYVYRKTVRLVAGTSEMVLEHHLKNTGRRSIDGTVYGHNFMMLDRQPIGPDFAVTLPFQIQSAPPPHKDVAEIRGNQFVYMRALADKDVVYTQISGFSDNPKDNEVRIENRGVGAGMVIRGNRPLSHMALWSIRSVLAVEPFISMTIEPGSEFDWDVTYEYYTIAPSPN